MLRRHFIALTAVGVGTLATGLPAMAKEDARPLLLLRGEGDRSVVDGFHDALDAHGVPHPVEAMLDRGLMFDAVRLKSLLVQHKSYRIVAITNDAGAFLLNSAVMDVRGRVLCAGHHIGGSHENAPSRHIFSATAAASGMAGAVYNTQDVAWTRALGGSLGMLAIGVWRPRADVDAVHEKFVDQSVKMATLVADL